MPVILFGMFVVIASGLSLLANRDGYFRGRSGETLDSLHRRMPFLFESRATQEVRARYIARGGLLVGSLLVLIGILVEIF